MRCEGLLAPHPARAPVAAYASRPRPIAVAMLLDPRLRRSLRAAVLLLVGLPGAPAADLAPRAISHEDFDAWRSIHTPVLSRDGRWLAYSFMPQDGDGDLVVRELATGREQRLNVGTLLPPPVEDPEEPGANPEAPPTPRNIRIAFTGDSRFVVASTHPAKAEIARKRTAPAKPEEAVGNGLLIVDLSSGETTRIPRVKSFQVPERGGAWVAFLRETATSAPPGNASPDQDRTAGRSSSSSSSSKSSRGGPSSRPSGTELILRDLDRSSQRTFAQVTDYAFARDGGALAYIVSSRAPNPGGVYVATPGAVEPATALLAGRGRYARLTWSRSQDQLAFLSARADGGVEAGLWQAYRWTRSIGGAATPLTFAGKAGPVGDLVLSERSALAFSRDGKKLYLPFARAANATRAPSGTVAAGEKVSADLWRWNDDFVQPLQKVRASRDRNRTFRGVLDLGSLQYTQLADEALEAVTLSDDGTRALGMDDRAYRRAADFEGRYADLHLVDPATGARRLVLSRQRAEGGSPQWSPDGRWVAWYQGRHWHVIDTTSGAVRALTDRLRHPVWNEQFDRPEPPPPYGHAGWTKDSRAFLVYDRYDVWQLFPDGAPPVNLTAGHGRALRTVLRVQRIDPEDADEDTRGLDPDRPLILRGESEDTRASGFFRTDFSGRSAPQRTLWGDSNHRYAGRAAGADVLLVTTSRFDTFPDVHTTDENLAALTKVTDGAAQQRPFLWGSSELVEFKGPQGARLKAALYKPADFNPAKKYPMIVYLYERLAQNVHEFVTPRPSQNINASLYTSNGYLVLMPDIAYRTGEPGESALRCVLAALAAVEKRGFVDAGAVGIQGHSWGGYQIAYMLTRTDRFRAAEAGAPVGNMTSAYSGIRWGSGKPRQFQYEHGQSRIGRSLADDVRPFIDNSPVFHLKNVRTPLLILANDQDDAVPFLQGVELFLGLRRLGKPAWLFNYNGEFHALRRRANQKDFSRRTHQFFDHFLKGRPAPDWLEHGIPYLDRESEKLRFNARPPVGADRP